MTLSCNKRLEGGIMYDNARKAVTWFSIIRLVFSLAKCFVKKNQPEI